MVGRFDFSTDAYIVLNCVARIGPRDNKGLNSHLLFSVCVHIACVHSISNETPFTCVKCNRPTAGTIIKNEQ